MSKFVTQSSRTTRTVDGEVDPRSVVDDRSGPVYEQHRALVPALRGPAGHPRYTSRYSPLVPALVGQLDVRDLDGRLVDRPDSSVEGRVDARRVAVEEDEDGRLEALLAPRHDVLDVGAGRVADLAVEDPRTAGVDRVALLRLLDWFLRRRVGVDVHRRWVRRVVQL